MKKILAAGAAVLALALTGCGPSPQQGEVVAHDYVGPWMQMICGGYTPQGVCSVWVPLWHPASYYLLIDPNTAIEDDEGWIEVSEATQQAYPVGSYWRAEE